MELVISIVGPKMDMESFFNLMQAIEQSCDVYFYELGLKVGIDKIAIMMKKLGLGQYYNIEIDDKAKGVVPNIEWKLKEMGLNGHWRNFKCFNWSRLYSNDYSITISYNGLKNC